VRGGAVADVVGPAEADLVPIEGARRVEGWSLVEILALLGGVAAYVGNDTGISHLAGVAGVRGAVVFGATSAHRWAPHHGRLAVVEAPSPCDAGIGVEAVSPDDVWAVLERGGCLDKVLGRQ
jgi:ADP-heptose:LPS heptosyltransferase